MKNLVVTLMKQFDVQSDDVYFAMLVSKGVPKPEAYIAIFKSLTTNNAGLANKHIRENPQINTLITYLNAEGKPGDPDEEGDDTENYKSKDYIIKELAKSLKGSSGKERADILIKIADLQRMKNEETKEEEEKVHYYLPLPICKDCPHKNNLLRRR